jgi:hypothetical protein
MQKTIFGANRAVALGDVRQVGGGAKSNPPAMAAAFERSHAFFPRTYILKSSATLVLP